MSDRTCLACGVPIDPSRRADAKVCPTPSCRMWARRHPGEKKPTGQITYTCQYERCGKTFTREKLLSAKRPRFCSDPCWESYRHYNLRGENYWRVENPFDPRAYTCVDCGRDGIDNGVGPIPQRCPECAVERSREKASEWQRNNKERANARKEAWAKANPDKVAESWERHRPKRMASMKLYRQRNRGRVLAWNRDRENRRRARKASVPSDKFASKEVFVRDNWMCGICKLPVNPNLFWPDPRSASLDHVIPISKGGSHTLGNVQLAHLGCNIAKGDSMPG